MSLSNIDNIKESIKFRVWQVISEPLTEEQQKAVTTKDKKTIDKLTTDTQKKQIDIFGKKSLLDEVDVNFTLGGVIYDCYCHQTPLPEAPLPRRLEDNRRQKFAEVLNEDIIKELDDELLEALKGALENDATWKSLVTYGFVKLKKDKKAFIPLNSVAVGFFKSVIDKACEVVLLAESDND